jgi:hypothetical protein
MTGSSRDLTRALQQLERRVLDLRRHTRALVRGPIGGPLAGSVAAVHGARQGLEAIAAAVLELRRQVVPFDGLGGPLGSTGELVLRAARWVLLREIDRLVVATDTSAASRREWTTRAMDARVVLRDQLDRATALWLPHRAPVIGQRSSVYRAAVRAALRAQQTLGHHPALRELLRAGGCLAGDRHPTEPHEHILTVLRLDLDLYLDPSPQCLAPASPRDEQARPVTDPGEP